MRKSTVRFWAFLAVLCFAIEAVASRCAEVPPGPKWLQTAVFYQVYPQSYFDSNGDGIGDLPGITANLDYIQSVGCNAIWINPIYESPFGDAGYDVADFYKVAPNGSSGLLSTGRTATRTGISGRQRGRMLRVPNHFPAIIIVRIVTCPTSFRFNRP